ncbi:C69 family dipeptidase [Bifidobacterium sp. ESL0764]|uniref:C69 family dipeptidase n=1 Tax=Bifidobacterium sp. ESL0764 TaxID=2983228 RepID=UPI0023F66868|nr:C69 family dipeptidase [Bifidobacterium sp. ESL0764]WEV65688.1 C69 family dipeptidase [Bifidobacterium sp. ESL0764]
MPCTTLLVGKNASYDGSTLIARNDDSGGGRYDPKRFVAVAPADQPRHYRSVLSHVEIDLPDDPCAYVMAPNALRNRGILAEAGVSERNVAMSATETIAVNERVLGADPMVELHTVPADGGGVASEGSDDGSGANPHGVSGTESAPSVDALWASLGEPEPYDSKLADDIANQGLDLYLDHGGKSRLRHDGFAESESVGGKLAERRSADGKSVDAGQAVVGKDDNAHRTGAVSVSASASTSPIASARSVASSSHIAEAVAGARREIPGGIGEEDIITLVLPYVRSAREGVKRLGGLLERYGTYEANGVSISDGDEVWYLESIGGHHWIARRVPDDCYAAIPNQLGLDHFDLVEALAEPKPGEADTRDYLCSADLREFIEANHLDRSMDSSEEHWHHLNPRKLFGTSTFRDHIYNTPRAWYMQRCLNPSEDWDSPAARYTPISDDIPWARRPESKISIEDVSVVLSSHYQDTPYDPYGHAGTPATRHSFRPIGISRTGHLAIMQIRGYLPAEAASYRSVMWLAFGSQPTTANAPFYTNVSCTPAYLRDTSGEVSTSTLYWTNRLIAALADAHFDLTGSAVEAFREDIFSHGHRFVAEADARLLQAVRKTAAKPVDGQEAQAAEQAQSVLGERQTDAARPIMQAANQRMADYLEARNKQLLDKVLYISSEHMHNAFALSDRPQQ